MKHLLTLLAALCLFAAPAAAQTIKSLGYNSTNGQIVAATNTVWTNSFSFSTNTVAAQVRTNLGLGYLGTNTVTTLTNLGIANIRSNSINTKDGVGGGGGSINLSGGVDENASGGSITLMAGNNMAAGSINLSASTNSLGGGGSITAAGIGNEGGGSLNMNGGSEGAGGSINTSDDGGSINTGGTGLIELGVSGTRTTLTGTATAARTISLPNTNGTIALTNTLGSWAVTTNASTAQAALFSTNTAPTNTTNASAWTTIQIGTNAFRVPLYQ